MSFNYCHRIIRPQLAGTEFLHTVRKLELYKNEDKICTAKKNVTGGLSLGEQSKLSLAAFPSHYHIRTSLAGKFLIYAVIFVPPLPPAHSGL